MIKLFVLIACILNVSIALAQTDARSSDRTMGVVNSSPSPASITRVASDENYLLFQVTVSVPILSTNLMEARNEGYAYCAAFIKEFEKLYLSTLNLKKSPFGPFCNRANEIINRSTSAAEINRVIANINNRANAIASFEMSKIIMTKFSAFDALSDDIGKIKSDIKISADENQRLKNQISGGAEYTSIFEKLGLPRKASGLALEILAILSFFLSITAIVLISKI